MPSGHKDHSELKAVFRVFYFVFVSGGLSWGGGLFSVLFLHPEGCLEEADTKTAFWPPPVS